MSHVELTLPDDVHKAVRKLARRKGIAPDELMIQAVTRTVEADRGLRELQSRAKKGSWKHFRQFLAKVPSVPPIPGDELPPGFKLPPKKKR